MNTRNASNVDYEMAQWHKLYKSIEENVRREILMDVNDKMNKLKRKNRKLKDQNKCLMEMMSMMRVQSAVPRFVPHTPSGLCTPVPEPVLVASKEPVIKEPPAAVASKEAAAVASKEAVVKVIHVKMEKVSTKNNITIDLCDNVQNEIVLKKELVAPPVVVIDEQEEFEQQEVEQQEEEEQEEFEQEEEEEQEVDEEQVEEEEEEQEEEEQEEEEQQEEEPKQVITAEVSKVVEP